MAFPSFHSFAADQSPTGKMTDKEGRWDGTRRCVDEDEYNTVPNKNTPNALKPAGSFTFADITMEEAEGGGYDLPETWMVTAKKKDKIGGTSTIIGEFGPFKSIGAAMKKAKEYNYQNDQTHRYCASLNPAPPHYFGSIGADGRINQDCEQMPQRCDKPTGIGAVIGNVVDGLKSIFEPAPPEEPPMMHEDPFMPEVQPEIHYEIPPPPPAPPKKEPVGFEGQKKPLAPPPMHEPIIGYDTAGNPIYDTPPPMDWGQIPIIGPIIDTMKGIPVNGEPPHEIPPVHPVGLPPHEEQAQLDPEEIEHRLRIVADFDKQEQEKLDNKSGELTDAGWKEWDNLRATYLDVSKPRFDYWRAIAENINTHTIPPVDCVVDVAPWSDEGWVDNCEANGVWVRSRQRPAKMTPPQYGGKPCPDYSELPPSVEERPCDPVDAKWKWSDWRECGEDGPSGIQVRTTILGEEAKYGGKPYEYRKEQRECEMPPEPIDCVMGEWTDWTACNSPGGGSTGMQERTRKQVIDPQHGGVPCNEMTYESRECQMPVVAEPTPEPEPVPDETPSAGATTVVDEPEPTIVEDIVNPIVDAIIGTGEAIFGWIDMGEGLEDTVTIPSQPVQVDAGTGQDSLLPVQTTPVAETVVEPEPTPAETPPPVEESTEGGGGAPVITTTETTEEEETEVEKCEDKNRETNADGSCGASCKDGHDWESTEADAKCVCVEGCWKKWAMYGGLLAGMASGGYYYFVKRKG